MGKNMNALQKWKVYAAILLLFNIAFGAGTLIAAVTLQNREAAGSTAVQASAEGNWGLSFQTEGAPPVANASADQLKKYNACYANMSGEKSST